MKDNDLELTEYLKRIERIPLVKHSTQIELFKLVENGDRSAKDKLISANLRLVVKFAKRYKRLGLPIMDLIQEGNLGLMKAVEKFDYRKGYKFSTYAFWLIRHAMIRGVVKKSRLVYLPFRVNDLLAKWVATERKLSRQLEVIPTDEETAKAMKINSKSFKEIQKWLNSEFVSFELYSSKDENRINAAMVYYNDSILQKEPYSLERILAKDLLQQHIYSLLDILNDREQEILKMRLLTKQPLSLAVIAKKFGLSRERVRQIEGNAITKLKKFIYTVEKEKSL